MMGEKKICTCPNIIKKTHYKKKFITNHNILDKKKILISLVLNQPSFLFLVWNTFLLDHYQTHYMISHLFLPTLYTYNFHITFTQLQEITQICTNHDF